MFASFFVKTKRADVIKVQRKSRDERKSNFFSMNRIIFRLDTNLCAHRMNHWEWWKLARVCYRKSEQLARLVKNFQHWNHLICFKFTKSSLYTTRREMERSKARRSEIEYKTRKNPFNWLVSEEISKVVQISAQCEKVRIDGTRMSGGVNKWNNSLWESNC